MTDDGTADLGDGCRLRNEAGERIQLILREFYDYKSLQPVHV